MQATCQKPVGKCCGSILYGCGNGSTLRSLTKGVHSPEWFSRCFCPNERWCVFGEVNPQGSRKAGDEKVWFVSERFVSTVFATSPKSFG
jgi:hypothetical protein